jgi:hypothetical protein
MATSIPPRRPFFHAFTGVVFCWRDKPIIKY